VRLWRVNTPLVAAVRVTGLYPNDTWSGRQVTYLRRRCKPGRLSVDLSSDDKLFLHPQAVVATSNGSVVGRVRLHGNRHVVLTVPVEPVPGTSECRVVYTVSPTAVPSEVVDGSTDHRELGAHFNLLLHRPTR
jgi:hypothetical protein